MTITGRAALPALPALDSEYPVERSAIEAYRRDGHVTLSAVAGPEEVSAYRQAIAEAAMAHNTETRPLEERDTYGRAFLQVWNLWRLDESVARFVTAERFARVAADLMGVDAVRLYHDQALFKEPGGGATPWHQDRYYWPLDTDDCVTMWMPLVDAYAGMEFVSGSHLERDLGGPDISDESDAHFQRLVAARSVAPHEVGPLVAGDATFHAGWMLHRAPGNPTEHMREVITVIYYADGSRVGALDSEARRTDLERWLPGAVEGGPAVSPLNPVLWRRADGARS